MARVWVIAENNQLKTLVSNKQKLWAQILERLNVSQDLLDDKLEFLTVTIYPNWKDNEEMNLTNPKEQIFDKQHRLYSIFKEHKHIKIHKGDFKDESLTIWEREIE